MRPPRGPIVVAVALLATAILGGCQAGVVVPKPNRYANEVDGLRAGWPPGWELVREGHDSRAGGAVDLLTIATFRPITANDAKCAPYGFRAVQGARQGDALFQLRTVQHLYPERPAGPRPESFLDRAERPEWRHGCTGKGADVRVVAFKEHGRFYEAFVWADAPLTERRREDIETIWAALEIEPIRTGLDDARVGRRYWHEISTHCGVVWTAFDARTWLATPPLMGHGGIRAPEGWDGPTEFGTIRLEDSDSAVFESRDGARAARFRPRTEADPPVQGCE